MRPRSGLLVLLCYAISFIRLWAGNADDPPQASFMDASHSMVLLNVGGKQYLVNVAAGTVQAKSAAARVAPQGNAVELFRQNCAECHGSTGKGLPEHGTPDFTSRSVQSAMSDQQVVSTIRDGKGRMPAWAGKLSDSQIAELASYVRSFGTGTSGSGSPAQNQASTPGVYQPGDDVLVTLPTGRPVDRHGLYFNFAHRFAYQPAFTGTGRGQILFGLDDFALSSFGFRYGVTDKLSIDVWRSPSFIDRPVQLMAGYTLLDEHHGAPLNLTVRASIEGQDNFRKNFTENIEAIFSRSITSRAQFYAVPTVSFNDRRLSMGSLRSDGILDLPGINAFSTGFGLAIDIRPTVALLAEVIPTLVNGEELGIHRPAYSFGIQKKIYRHAFTLGFTNSPGTTVSQRAGTNATFLDDPMADKPSGLFIGFDITRQIR